MNSIYYNGRCGYSNRVDRQRYAGLPSYSTAPISDRYPTLRRNYISHYASNLMTRSSIPSHYFMLGGSAANNRVSSIGYYSPQYCSNSTDYRRTTLDVNTANRNQRMTSLRSVGRTSVVASENGGKRSQESNNRKLNSSSFRHEPSNVVSIASVCRRACSPLAIDDGPSNYALQREPESLSHCCDDMEPIAGAVNDTTSASDFGVKLESFYNNVPSASVKTSRGILSFRRRLPNETLWEIVQFLSYAECERNATVSRVLTHLIAPRMRLRIKILLEQIEKTKNELHVTNGLIAERKMQISTLNGQILDMNDRLAGMSGRLSAMNEQIVDSHQRIDGLLKRLRSIRFCDESETAGHTAS